MQIVIRNSSNEPIYQQIVNQIKSMILSGELQPNETLPSIRTLAKDLRVSNITTKRAYEELLRDGFIISNSTKGYYVKEKNSYFVKEEVYKKLEQKMEDVVQNAKMYKIKKEELLGMLNIIYEEED